jgi:hemoglobin-like flavoprotein
MTRDQIARVRSSWALVVPLAEVVAGRFYERLFTLDPSLRPLFSHTDSAAQPRKFVQTLAVVVAGLDDLAPLRPAIEALGQRHAAYGVTDSHYDTVRQALLWTLECALGPDFDAPTREAWDTAYRLLATVMQRAVVGEARSGDAAIRTNAIAASGYRS